MFASSTGFLGLAPHGTRDGDVVAVIRGFNMPYLLRPKAGSIELIGEVHVQGIMDGEALQMAQLIALDAMVR